VAVQCVICYLSEGLAKVCLLLWWEMFLHSWWEEQRALGPSNFKFVANFCDDPNCFVHIEHGSKNQCGSLGDLRVEMKKFCVMLLG